jgi:hypothetical protein
VAPAAAAATAAALKSRQHSRQSPPWLKAAASNLRAAHNAAVVFDDASVEPSNSETSGKIKRLKDRADFRGSWRILATETIRY